MLQWEDETYLSLRSGVLGGEAKFVLPVFGLRRCAGSGSRGGRVGVGHGRCREMCWVLWDGGGGGCAERSVVGRGGGGEGGRWESKGCASLTRVGVVVR